MKTALTIVAFIVAFVGFTEEPLPTIENRAAEIQELMAQSAHMALVLKQEKRSLATAKSKWLAEYNNLDYKYKDETFAKTKSRADKKRLEIERVGIMKAQERFNAMKAYYDAHKVDLNAKIEALKLLVGEGDSQAE